MNNEVNSRETYLKYRRDWRSKYASLSAEIRTTKALRHPRHPDYAKSSPTQIADSISRAQSRLPGLRARAREMMANLAEVKATRPIRRPEQIAA